MHTELWSGKMSRRWEDNFEVDFNKQVVRVWGQWQSVAYTVMNVRVL